MWGFINNQDVGSEAATIKECVIAHWSRDPAPKIPGAKVRNRSCGCIRKVYGVGERSHRVEVELEGSVDLWEVRMLV